MAFTAVLGTADAKLGNILLGVASVSLDPFEQSAESNVIVTDSVSVYIPGTKTTIANVIVTQSVGLNKVLNLNITSTVIPTQQVKRIFDLTVTSTITITQTRNGDRIKPVSSTITPTHIVGVSKVYSRSVSSFVLPIQTITRSVVYNLNRSSTITPTQISTRIPVKSFSVSDTIIVTQELIRERIFTTNSQLINLGDSVSVSKVISISILQNINPTDLVSRNVVINRSVSDQITYPTFRIVPYRVGGVIELLLPALQATKVHSKYMVLSVGSKAITLPAPLFGDRIGNTDLFTMSMAKTGKIYTTVKRSPSKNINYSWDLFSGKAEELKEFLWEFNSEAIKIENWKGEIWFARLLTNPINFAEEVEHRDWCGGKVSVALDFEGLRVH